MRLELPEPKRTPQGWEGQVLYIDPFGKIITNITREILAGQPVIRLHLGGTEISGMVRTFGERPPGEIIALFGSTGSLIVSVVNGSAANAFEVKMGDKVEVDVS